MTLEKFCVKKVTEEFGEEYVAEFEDKWNKINSGIPIGGFVETAIFLDMVDKFRKEYDQSKKKSIWNLFKRKNYA